jgi:hypothetical protein
MTRRSHADAVIGAFFEQPQPELPDRVFDAVRGDIHRTRQRIVVGPVAMPNPGALRELLVAAAVVVVAVAVVAVSFRPATGPGILPPTPSPSPSASPSNLLASPEGPTHFTSQVYGYALTLPPGWSSRPALSGWDGQSQPAFGGDEVDSYLGPGDLIISSFAGSFSGDLQAFVDDRIAANVRDHADTCPPESLQVNEPISVAGQAGVLLGWDCGGLVNQAVTVRNGVAYAFGFRDLGIKAARDPTDLAILRSFLDSVELPATPSTPGP